MDRTFTRAVGSRSRCACGRIACFMSRGPRTCCGACRPLRSASAQRRGSLRGMLGGRGGWRSSLGEARRKRLSSSSLTSVFSLFFLVRRFYIVSNLSCVASVCVVESTVRRRARKNIHLHYHIALQSFYLFSWRLLRGTVCYHPRSSGF